MNLPTPFVLLTGAVLLAACSMPPPKAWLRYEPAGATTWVATGDGKLGGSMHGAPVRIDLERQQTRVEVMVENTTGAPIELRMGPEGEKPKAAIGEVLLRPLQGPPGIGGPDMIPYVTMQPLVVEAGWRGTFYLDAPLGREPILGQYFVLTVEARDAAGTCERRTLPLQATNAGTTRAGAR
jgi:hypothetical protein